MNRWLREGFVLSGVSATVALAVLVAGTAMAHTGSEVDPPEWWPVSACYTARIVALSDLGVSGSALICTADDAVRPALYVSGLTPGRVYSASFLPFERWPECGSSPCGNVRAESGHVGIVSQFGVSPAGPDGTAHFRGHFDGWNLASGTDVTLLVTHEGGGDGAFNRTLGCEPFGLPIPCRGGSSGTVVALATFRLP